MVHDMKNKEVGPLSWGVRKNLNTKFLVLRVWEEEINQKKIKNKNKIKILDKNKI